MTAMLKVCCSDLYLAWAASVLVQSTVVLGCAWLLASVVVRRYPAARYVAWLVALGLLLLSPLTAYLAISSGLSVVELRWPPATSSQPTARGAAVPPELHRPVHPPSATSIEAFPPHPLIDDAIPTRPTGPSDAGTVIKRARVGEPAAMSPASGPSMKDKVRFCSAVLSLIWGCGTGFLFIRFSWRTGRLFRLLDKTRRLDRADIHRLLEEVGSRLGLRRVPGLLTWTVPDARLAPITVGVLRQRIVLSSAMIDSLSLEQLWPALVHECAHALRHDALVGAVQRLAVIAFWPHPLIWLMDRELTHAREDICDNYALQESDSGSYAESLVEISKCTAPSSIFAAQMGLFARPRRLEQRIAAILDENRICMTKTRLVSAGILATVLFVAFAFTGSLRLTGAQPPVTAAASDTTKTAETPSVAIAEENPTAARDEHKPLQELGLRPIQTREDGRVNGVAVQHGPLTAQVVQKLKELPALDGLSLERSDVSDRELALLHELPGIAAISLSDKQATTVGIRHLTRLPNLTRLHLIGPGVTDTVVMELTGIPSLQFLGLTGTRVSEPGLVSLRQLPHLRVLTFQPESFLANGPVQPTITEKGVAKLEEIEHLKVVIYDSGIKVTDSTMSALSTLPRLGELTILGGDITDAGLKNLQSATGLKKLVLKRAKWLTDAGLEHLQELTQLRELELSNGEFTDSGMAFIERLSNLETHIPHPKIQVRGLREELALTR